MNKDPNTHIDKLFERSNLDREFIPSEADWEGIRNLVVKKKSSRKRFWFLLFAIGVFGLFLNLIISSSISDDGSQHSATKPIEDINIEQQKLALSQDLHSKENAVKDKSEKHVSIKPSVKNLIAEDEKNSKLNNTKNDNGVLLSPNKHIKPRILNEVASLEQENELLNENLSNQNNLAALNVNESAAKVLESKKEDKLSTEEREMYSYLASIESLQLADLLVEESYVEMEQIIPNKERKLNLYVSISSDFSFKTPSIILASDIYKHNRLSIKGGLVYQYYGIDNGKVSEQNQQYFTFGQNTRNTFVELNNVHYGGISLIPTYQVWKNFEVSIELNALYRINAIGNHNYNSTNLTEVSEKVNLPNRYTNDFNFSIRPMIQYQIGSYSIGIGYQQFASTAISNSEYVMHPQGNVFFNISKMF